MLKEWQAFMQRRADERFKKTRQDHIETFKAEIARMKKFRELIQKTACPGCGSQKLVLVKFDVSAVGWQCDVKCEACQANGFINQAGTQISNLTGKPLR